MKHLSLILLLSSCSLLVSTEETNPEIITTRRVDTSAWQTLTQSSQTVQDQEDAEDEERERILKEAEDKKRLKEQEEQEK
ncbi:hypothetical protein K9K77_02855 [Candidatus Babeliales bacterium]|nr:hypothetical protein [Candidatus Babeliales bacterium]